MNTHLVNEFWEPDPDFLTFIPQLKEENVRKVLDLGCGVGRHSVRLASKGFETYAVDSSQSALEYCKSKIAEQNLNANVVCANMHNLPLLDESFDAIISWNVIYYTTRACMSEIISEIIRILRPQGLISATLNSTRNKNCGIGKEVEPYTFDNPEKEDGVNLHHYSDERDALDLLSQLKVEFLQESEQKSIDGCVFPDSWHWIVLARKRKST
jgi:ubiquinone/menaquinone biosynthesis C-methylase UbiE